MVPFFIILIIVGGHEKVRELMRHVYLYRTPGGTY